MQGGRGLGRGLSALLDESEPETASTAATDSASTTRQKTLPVAFLKPNRHQPRRAFKDEELQDLAASIRDKGVLQPILVRPLGTDSYEIVAGERRWRAAQLAKLHEIPVVIRSVSDAQSLEMAIVENVQRSDLNAIEEGAAYQELMNQFHYTQEKLSEVIGKSRSHVANTLRLLKLPESVQVLIVEGKLSAGHARTLIGAQNPEALAREILEGALNVRQAEKKARAPKKKSGKGHKDADTKALETSVSNSLGLDVKIEHEGDRGGAVKIRYKSLEQLDEIIRRLNSFVEVD